jgi:capsular exopolysaccharide synthesis family protein
MYRLATLLHPHSSAAEAYRTLRTNVEFASIDQPLRTLLVTSALPSEGKTVTTANLAIVYAQNDRHVLLVDADLRRPGIHEIFELSNSQGLTTLLRSDASTLGEVAKHTENDNLDVLTTGPVPANPGELLGSRRMRKVLADLQAAYDLVIFDTAPLELFADAAVLGSLTDGVLLVVDAAKSRRGAVRGTHETLTRAEASILGAVINGVKAPLQSDYYDYFRSSATETATSVDISPAPAAESRTD